MRFKPYPKYKDSGVEWLGDIPEHWSVIAIKHIVSTPVTDGPHETPEFVAEGIPFVSAEAVSSGEIDFSKIRGYISKSDHIKYSKKYCPKRGDIFVIKSGATTGICAIVETDIEFNIWSPLAVIRCSKKTNNFFILNFLRSKNFQDAFALNWSFGTQQNIGMGVIENLRVTVPPQQEQTAIANFLDRETRRINALVEEKNRFIELLKEKRQALISHAVTKGLDPTVKMKDSGVDWLGEVPEHWDIKKIKHIFEIRKRIAGKEGYPVLSITQRGIKVKDTISGEGQLAMDYSKYQFVEIGDFAMNHMDLLTGYVDISNFHGVTSPDYRVFALTDSNSLDKYYLYLMQMGYTNKIFFSYGQGVANIGRWRFQTEPFINFYVPYPNKKEQQQIVDFLDRQTAKIDTLIQETQTSIELLKEHRSALISAAVTGKIDVREVA